MGFSDRLTILPSMYGLRIGPGGRLVREPREEAALARIRALRAAGLSLRAISRALAAKGMLARNGRPFTAKVLLTLAGRGRGTAGAGVA